MNIIGSTELSVSVMTILIKKHNGGACSMRTTIRSKAIIMTMGVLWPDCCLKVM